MMEYWVNIRNIIIPLFQYSIIPCRCLLAPSREGKDDIGRLYPCRKDDLLCHSLDGHLIGKKSSPFSLLPLDEVGCLSDLPTRIRMAQGINFIFTEDSVGLDRI